MDFSNIKVIVFDIDGTMIDTDELVIRSYQEVFNKYRPDYQLSLKEKEDFIGPPLEIIFKKYFTEDFNTLLKTYQSYADKHLLDAKLFPYVKELLTYLKNNNYLLFVFTTRFKDSCLNILNTFNLTSYFDEIVTLSDVNNPKPSPEGLNYLINKYSLNKDNIIFIGDTINDILAGQNAGVYTGLYKQNGINNFSITPDVVISSYRLLKEKLNNE